MTRDDKISPLKGTRIPDPGRPNAEERALIILYAQRGHDGPPPQVYGWGDGYWTTTGVDGGLGEGTKDPSEVIFRTIREWTVRSLTPKSEKKRYTVGTQDVYCPEAPTENCHGEPFLVMCNDCLDSPVYSDENGQVGQFCEVCERRRERRGLES